MKDNEENLKQEITAVKAELIKLQEVAVQEPIAKQPDSLPAELPEKTVSVLCPTPMCTHVHTVHTSRVVC